MVSSQQGFGFGATDAFYPLPPDNSAQVQQNTAQIASTNAQVQQDAAQIASNTSEIAKTQGEVQRLGAQVDENTSAIERNTAAIANQEKRIDENSQGVAMALATQNPDLTGNEYFGITANWGDFEGANGFGMGFEGVLAHDLVARGDRIAVTGGWGGLR